jgi:hypothetical protein
VVFFLGIWVFFNPGALEVYGVDGRPQRSSKGVGPTKFGVGPVVLSQMSHI